MLNATMKSETTSSYAAYRDGRLTLLLEPESQPTPLQEFIHDSFRALVQSRHFACVGAKAAIHRGSYRVGLYGELGSAEATVRLANDLHAFVEEYRGQQPMFVSFAASFTEPVAPTEKAFEALLWKQLQALHDLDWPLHGWDSSVSDDPTDPSFSFSFSEQAFFVVGLHPASSRWMRRFAWPTLIFNRHDQFEQLRKDGRYASMQRVIRKRDRALQGRDNPMLREFGAASEAQQYSGRLVDGQWSCPFHAHTKEDSSLPS